MKRDPFLCPTHKIEMEFTIIKPPTRICSECNRLMYKRITEMKMKIAQIKRISYLSENPKAATLWEGL